MTRSRPILILDATPAASHRWDFAILSLLVAMIAFMPFAYGAVEAWSQLVIVGCAAALGLLLLLRLGLDRGFRFEFSPAYIPLALYLGLIAFQAMPLPTQLVRAVSPAAVEVRHEFLGERLASTAPTTLSVYPYATRQALRLAFVGSMIFVTVASVVRKPEHSVALLWSVFAIGCVEAALAVAQIATGAERIYWSTPVVGAGVVTSGTFVNHSNYTQFLNLSLGAGLALLLIKAREQYTSAQDSWRRWLADMWESHASLLAGILLISVAVFASLSRNGALSMVVSAAIVGCVMSVRQALGRAGWILWVLPMCVMVLVLFFGFDKMYSRFSRLRSSDDLASRWELTSDTLRAWFAHPMVGTGLGTHAYVFPMFDSSALPILSEYADNEYVQLLEETGAAGTVMAATFLGIIAYYAVRLIVYGRSSYAVASYGLSFGILSAALQSMSDFGQRVPAVFGLSAVTCGLVVALHRIEFRTTRNSRAVAAASDGGWRMRQVAAAAVVIVLAVVSWWALRGAYAAYLGERWWAATAMLAERIQNSGDQATDQDYIELLAAAESAVNSDPGNVEYQYWLAYYRWEAMSRTVDAATGQTLIPRAALASVSRIADDLSAARVLCATYGPPYALEGQLRLNVLQDEQGKKLVYDGHRLAPYDPPTCFAAGEVAARDGDLEEAERLLSRAVAMQPALFRDAAQLLVQDLKRPEAARELAGSEYRRLNELAEICATEPQFAALSDELRTAAVKNLRDRSERGDASAAELVELAEIELAEGRADAGIGLYRRALAMDYQQVHWRLKLAQALNKSGKVAEAVHELRICLRLKPEFSAAARLLEELAPRVEAADTAR